MYRLTATSRRFVSVLAGLLTLTMGASVGWSQQVEEDLEPQQSDIYGAFEIKLGGYYPSNLNDTPDSAGVGDFERFYGNDSVFYAELGLERYIFQRFGKLGIGLNAGRGSETGQSLQQDEMGGMTEAPGESTFRVFPLRASLVYKYDYSAIHHGVPFVPVFRVGADYVIWRILGNDGEVTTSPDGSEAQGATTGWHASIGLQFMLDYIDPSSAASFDMSWGVNNSYLFAEYMITRIDNFGSPTAFDLSDNLWLFGLAFEF